jgi:hypothetical protein
MVREFLMHPEHIVNMKAHACRKALIKVKSNTCINEQEAKTGKPLFFSEAGPYCEDNDWEMVRGK